MIAGDAILSFYSSATGRYRGFECMQQKDAKHYLVRGAMLEQDKVISTWVLELKLSLLSFARSGIAIGRAVSKARAARSTSASAYFGPTMCSPAGKPAFVSPQGIDAAGCCVRLKG